jgi:hypothetical protein
MTFGQSTHHCSESAEHDFTAGRVSQKLDLFHALTQLVQSSDAAVNERSTERSRCRTMRVAPEQTSADCSFKIADRLGNDGQ